MKNRILLSLCLVTAACSQGPESGVIDALDPATAAAPAPEAEALPSTGDARLDATLAAMDKKYQRIADAQAAEIASLRAQNAALAAPHAPAGETDLEAAREEFKSKLAGPTSGGFRGGVVMQIDWFAMSTEQKVEKLKGTTEEHSSSINALLRRVSALEAVDANVEGRLAFQEQKHMFPEGFCGMQMVTAESLGVRVPQGTQPYSMYFMITHPCR